MDFLLQGSVYSHLNKTKNLVLSHCLGRLLFTKYLNAKLYFPKTFHFPVMKTLRFRAFVF